MGNWKQDYIYLQRRLSELEQQLQELRTLRGKNQRPEDQKKDKALARAEHLIVCEIDSVEYTMEQAMRHKPA